MKLSFCTCIIALLICNLHNALAKKRTSLAHPKKRGRTKPKKVKRPDGSVNASSPSSGDVGTRLSSAPMASEGVLSTVAVGSDEDLRSESNVQLLRSTGHYYLRLKDYKGAAKYYSAILQLYEGIGGSESRDVRRRCCLTLAECEIKMGNFMHAISLCSEVIEEASLTLESEESVKSATTITTIATTTATATLTTTVEKEASVDTEVDAEIDESREEEKEEDKENDEQQEIHDALGKAHYRRAMSFLHLNYLHLALLDLQVAHEKLPENESILDHIVDVDEKIKEETGKDQSTDDTDTTEDAAETDVTLNNVDSEVVVDTVEDKADAVALDELILDIVDESHCLERRRYSPRQLQHLISEANHHKLSGFNSNAGVGNAMANPFGDLSSMMGGMPGGGGGGGGLVDLLGAGGAGAGGASGLMSMLGPLAGMAGKGGKGKGFALPSSETILNMFPTLGSMMGLKPDTIQTSKEILEAVMDVGKFIFGIWKRIKPYKDLVFMAATCIFFWLKIKAKR